jgi:hypothetical protein
MANIAIGGQAFRRGVRPAPTPKFVAVAMAVLVLTLWAPALTSVGDLNLNFLITSLLAVAILAIKGDRPNLLSADRAAFGAVVGAALFLAAFSLLSFLWAELPFRVFRVGYGQAFCAIILLLFVRFHDSRLQSIVINNLVAGVLISSFLAIAGSSVPAISSALGVSGDRTAALFKHSNQLGIALSLTFPLMIGFLFTWKKSSILALVGIAVSFLGLALSGSKTNILLAGASATVTVITILFINEYHRRRPLIMLITFLGLGISVVSAAAVLEAVNPRSTRIITNFAQGGEVQSLQIRQGVHAAAVEEGLANPLGGVGAGQYTSGRRYPHSHNVFLDYFRTLGIPGLAGVTIQISAVLLLAASALRLALVDTMGDRRQRIMMACAAFGAINYLSSNQFSDSFGASTLPLFWLCVALIFSFRVSLRTGRKAPRSGPRPVRLKTATGRSPEVATPTA